jgi:hypothetical protein
MNDPIQLSNGLEVQFDNRRSIFAACAYLAFLFSSACIMWWLVLAGGDPLTVGNPQTLTISGASTESFRAGDIAVVRRRICAARTISVQGYPRLVNESGISFPLVGGVAEIKKGCNDSNFAIDIPRNLPAGLYRYSNMVRFQNNLVGRDEYAIFPSITIKVAS